MKSKAIFPAGGASRPQRLLSLLLAFVLMLSLLPAHNIASAANTDRLIINSNMPLSSSRQSGKIWVSVSGFSSMSDSVSENIDSDFPYRYEISVPDWNVFQGRSLSINDYGTTPEEGAYRLERLTFAEATYDESKYVGYEEMLAYQKTYPAKDAEIPQTPSATTECVNFPGYTLTNDPRAIL